MAEMAERKGFEPLRRLPAYTLSRRAPSTTRPSLRAEAGAGCRRREALPREAAEGAEHPSKGGRTILIARSPARAEAGRVLSACRRAQRMQKGPVTGPCGAHQRHFQCGSFSGLWALC